MKIIIDDKIPYIKGKLESFADQVIYCAGKAITSDLVKDADILIIRTRTKCDAKLLEGSSVKLICTATIGTDHIDLPWCEAHGIKVCHSAGCNAPAVAQYVWSLLLLHGLTPESSTIGIIGYGNIGKIVGQLALINGASIMVSDPPLEKSGYREVSFTPLSELLEKSDVVTIHTPLTYSGENPTFHLIGEKELSLVKEGSFIVNAARGGVIDEKALLRSVSGKRLKAIIDVWENEPCIDPELLKAAVIATPHIAGYSLEGKMRATRMVMDNVLDFLGYAKDKIEISPDTNISGDNDWNREGLRLAKDSEALKTWPEHFELLRENYNLRHEILRSFQR